ncbi:unnamed protein product, partial [Mesorhabditis spiculigera]
MHRKFFHLVIGLIYLSGIYYEPRFTWLCGYLWLCIFVCFEVLRYFQVPPWSTGLDSLFLIFKDKQDGKVLMTPMYLLFGVFCPLFLDPLTQPRTFQMRHLAGILTVVVGDSMAAIGGYLYGQQKWPGRNKTYVGSMFMAASVFLCSTALAPLCAQPIPSLAYRAACSIVLTFIEAYIENFDNVLLPLVGYVMLL